MMLIHGALRLLLLAAIASLCGCAKNQVTFHHASFTRAHLTTGRLAIAAVGALGAGELEGADEMAYAVRERLIAGEPALQVLTLAEVRQGFAPGHHARWQREFYDKPRWEEQDFYVFNWLTNQVRYLLLVTILGTEVSSGDSYDGGWSEDLEWDPVLRTYTTRRSNFTPYSASRYAHRWTRASFFVYDLQLRLPVWEIIADASLHARKTETSPYTLPGLPSGPGAVSLIGGLDCIALKVAEKLPQ